MSRFQLLNEAYKGCHRLTLPSVKNLTRSPLCHLKMSKALATSQRVTLPDIPELYDPNFLDVLLPPADPKMSEPTLMESEKAGSTLRNAMMDALKTTANRTFTENLAPAYSSTGSPTLDAFQFVKPRVSKPQLNTYLKNAWDEDSSLTLKIIWNHRSIHDGKGDKETFYRYAHPASRVLLLILTRHYLLNIVHSAGFTTTIHGRPFLIFTC